jgi:hypothetical protein
MGPSATFKFRSSLPLAPVAWSRRLELGGHGRHEKNEGKPMLELKTTRGTDNATLEKTHSPASPHFPPHHAALQFDRLESSTILISNTEDVTPC